MNDNIIKNKSSKHWIVLMAVCGLCIASLALGINAVGVFFQPMAETFGVDRGIMSLNFTFTFLVVAAVTPFVARILKKYSLKSILLTNTIIGSLSFILMAFVSSIVWIYILAIFRGISIAFLGMVVITMVINSWFHKKHGLAVGLVLGFSGLGGAIFTQVFYFLIGEFGWETAIIIKGIIYFLLCFPAIVYPFTLKPEDSGLIAYGKEEVSVGEKALKTSRTTRTYVYSAFAVTILAIFVFLGMSIASFPQWFSNFAHYDLGHTTQLGALLISAALVGNVTSKFTIGIISDIIGPVKSTMIMIGLNIIGTIMLLTITQEHALIFAAFIFGAIYAVSTAAPSLLTKHIFGIENYSKVFPIASAIGWVGLAVSTAAIGFSADITGSFTLAFYLTFLMNALSIVIIFALVRIVKVVEVTEEPVQE